MLLNSLNFLSYKGVFHYVNEMTFISHLGKWGGWLLEDPEVCLEGGNFHSQDPELWEGRKLEVEFNPPITNELINPAYAVRPP